MTLDMMATQTNQAARKEPSDKRSIDQIAALLDLPTWESVDELNCDYYAEVARAATRFDEEHASNLDERQAVDDRYLATEERAQAEVYAKWHGAVLHAAESLFGAHGLELVPVKDGQGTPSEPYTYRVVPSKSWLDAADMIHTTITGVGAIACPVTTREFIAALGDGTPRRAALGHLGWIRRYPDVYASTSARVLYEGAWS